MRCQLRKWRLTDAKDLAKSINNKNVQANLRDGIPYPYTEEDAENYIREMLVADPYTTFAFAITVDDKAIGSMGVFRQGNIHQHAAEMGYYLAEPFWGKGLGTSAVQQASHYIFTHTNIFRIYAEPFACNKASCRILEKSGFQYEGTLRCHAVKDGRILDMKLYALVKASVISDT